MGGKHKNIFHKILSNAELLSTKFKSSHKYLADLT